MDGLSLVRQLKADAATRDIPVVAVSAHAMRHNIDQALAAGCVEYVTKPLTEDPFAFVDRLARLLPTSP
jgi:CheY-like chemotaxis protein